MLVPDEITVRRGSRRVSGGRGNRAGSVAGGGMYNRIARDPYRALRLYL